MELTLPQGRHIVDGKYAPEYLHMTRYIGVSMAMTAASLSS